MDYWKGQMNAPLNINWKCVVCGAKPLMVLGIGIISSGLTWGFVNAQCRCDTCHTIYTMKNGDLYTFTPICLIEPEYLEAFKRIWVETHILYEEVPKELWEKEIVKESV